MPTVKIDNQQITVPEGTTILNAAGKLGIEIPTLCWAEGFEPSVSCMLCAVEVEGLSRLVPACASPVKEGMVVRTDTETVMRNRQMVLELFLSHHTGDCEAPCTVACPAGFDIPRMLRHQMAGEHAEAAMLVEQLVLPRSLGYVCPAPCEKACRRRLHDGSLPIPVLHGSAGTAEVTLDPAKETGRSVAVVGGGPAGLGAALHLRLLGHSVTVLERSNRAGGGLWSCVDAGALPGEVLQAEISSLSATGIQIETGREMATAQDLAVLRDEYDAAVIACGSACSAVTFGLKGNDIGVTVDKDTRMTSVQGVFAAGGAVRAIKKMAVRAIASGQTAARMADAYIRGDLSGRRSESINVSMGKLRDGELARLLEDASGAAGRVGGRGPIGLGEAEDEARRCLHCDCRAATDCKLRNYASEYGANVSRWRDKRPPFEHDLSHPDVVYEPGKCIACGLCIQVTKKAGEPYGQAFLGRGIAVRIAPPLGEELKAALTVSAEECVRVCPTGALAFR